MDFFDILLAKKLEDDRDPKVEGLSVTANGTYSEDGVVYKPVVVNVPETPLSSLSVTANGTYTAPTGTGYNEVSVNVPLPENAYLLEEYEDVPTDIASFTDGTDNPLKSLTASIVPVQAGSGDPSPENVRPISGWTEEVVSVVGKNRITSITEGIELNSSDGNTKSNASWYVSDYSRVEYGKTYYVSGTSSSTVCYYDRYKNFTRNTLSERTITPNESEYYVRVNSLISGYAEPQIEEGNEATSFSPFGTTTTIPFTDGQGQSVEVYGGSVDVVNGGEQQRTLGSVDLGTLDWNKSSDGNFYATLIGISNFNDTTPKGICSCYKLGNYTQWTNKTTDGIIFGVKNSSALYVRDSRFTDATAFKTSVNGQQLVYELATPTTFYTQPTSIKSLDGENNVSASTGEIEDLEFYTKEAS